MSNSSPGTPYRNQRAGRSALLWLAAMLVLILILIVTSLQQTRRDAVQVAQLAVRNLTQVLESRLVGDFDRIFGLLRVAAGSIDRASMQPDAPFGGRTTLTVQLAQLRASFPELEAISIFDAAGALRFSSAAYPQFIDISGQPYFVLLRSANAARAAYSDIVGSPESGHMAVVFALALRDENNRFLGVVQASLPVEAISSLLAGIDPGRLGVALLRRSDTSVLIAREPRFSEADFNRPLPPDNPIRKRIDAGEREGSLSYTASTDGLRRAGHFKVMERHPFYVQVAVAEDDFLQGWQRQSRIYGALAVLMTLALLSAIYRLRKGFAAEQAAREQLAHQQRRLASVIEGTNAGTWEWDLHDDRIECNARWAAISGISPADAKLLHGSRWHELIHPDERDGMRAALSDHLHGLSEYFDVECRVASAQDGWTWVHDRGRVVARDEHGAPHTLAGTRSDISERKRIERMKNEFIATVSHELRTPLTAISGTLGLLANGAAGLIPDAARELLVIASRNSQRLELLIRDLLDMEKLLAGKLHFELREQALRPLVEQAVRDNQAYADQFEVRLQLAPGPDAQVRVDADRLQQVLANLLSNAAKFSPQGDCVDIDVRSTDGHARVSVTDHGPGIPAAFRERIFQKFSQADASDTRQKGGTGLGLAISRELVERMNGTIGFESVEGHGATFWFDFAVYADSTQEAADD